jgi:hypothetical protein
MQRQIKRLRRRSASNQVAGSQSAGVAIAETSAFRPFFSRDLASYNPRACDCDFCRKHVAAYVSDPSGSLQIQIRNELEVNRLRQRSHTAEMLLFRTCGVLVAALYRESNRLFGALNVKALDSSCGPEQGVSPKLLSPEQKVRRWRDIWFPDVILNIERSS